MPTVGISIQYSTQDQEFIAECIEQALTVTSHVAVGYMDKQFDGQPENLEQINQIITLFPQVDFYMIEWRDVNPWLFHGKVRQEGFDRLKDKADYVIYLDSDEIIIPELFIEWLKNSLSTKHESYKFLNYVYFGSRKFRAKTLQDSIIMRKVDSTNKALFYRRPELDRLQLATNCLTRIGYKDQPMFNHYSWAKGEKQMERKLRTFAHKPKTEQEVQALLQAIKQFDGTTRDPVWGYKYDIINP